MSLLKSRSIWLRHLYLALSCGIGVVTLVGEESFDPVGDHPEQGRKALGIMRLPGRQDKAARTAFRIAAGMELGGEAAARSTSSARVSSIASNTPVSTQRRYRRKTLFHLPYSSGKCRYCAAVRAIHIMPSK
ncbi:hypothetical protein [Shinella sp. 838]|uniref:hypothetical protein n=1 Tax=Shinella sp. 838 TaxID=3038164 RepID=UPI003FA7022B